MIFLGLEKMSKHYFNTKEGIYGVALSALANADIDRIASLAPQYINKIHEKGNVDITDAFRRVWCGRVQYDEGILTYVIGETLERRSNFISVVVVGGISEKSLEARTNEILDMFRLTEVSSQREVFQSVIKEVSEEYFFN